MGIILCKNDDTIENKISYSPKKSNNGCGWYYYLDSPKKDCVLYIKCKVYKCKNCGTMCIPQVKTKRNLYCNKDCYSSTYLRNEDC